MERTLKLYCANYKGGAQFFSYQTDLLFYKTALSAASK